MTPAADKDRILRARAAALAREPAAATTAATIEVVAFALAGERYGVECAYVREVLPLRDLTPVPCTPAFILGILNVRGRLLTVLDLRTFFNLSLEGIHDLHEVLVLQGNDMDLGLAVDAVLGVRPILVDQVQATLPTGSPIGEALVRGVTADRLIVLDAAGILADRRIVAREQGET